MIRFPIVMIAFLALACSSLPKSKVPGDPVYIPSNQGKYMSPYTHDGVLADWVDKGVGVKAGAQLGKTALGTTAGVIGDKYGGDIIGILGRTVGQLVGSAAARAATMKRIGGYEYVQATSDISFNSLRAMANFLRDNYRRHPHFALAIDLTAEIYPEFGSNYAHWVKEAARP